MLNKQRVHLERIWASVALASIFGFLQACDSKSAESSPPLPRIRLADLASGRLEQVGLGTPSLVWSENFKGGLASWHSVTSPLDPGRKSEGVLFSEVLGETRQSSPSKILRLSGKRGLLVQTVKVEAQTVYLLKAS